MGLPASQLENRALAESSQALPIERFELDERPGLTRACFLHQVARALAPVITGLFGGDAMLEKA
jgi:hypothetical protein